MNDSFALLFDYGGVLVSSPFERVGDYAAMFGVSQDLATELVFGGPTTPRTHPWNLLECGLIEYDSYQTAFEGLVSARGVELPCPPLDVIYDLTPRRELLGVLKSLTTHTVHLGLATNNVAAMRDVWLAHVAGPPYRFTFDSSQMGVRKPDSTFFDIVVERLIAAGLSAEHSWLIDDLPENVEAAEAAGLRGALAPASEASLVAQVTRIVRQC